MEKIKKDEYIKWYKISRDHVNDFGVIPDLTDKEILKNISKMNWLMFVKATHEERKDAVNYPEPNMYLIIGKDILKIGLTFNNAPSVDKLKNILNKNSKIERERIVEKLLALNDSYDTIVLRKIRKFRGPPPTYNPELDIQTNKLDDKNFQKIIDKCIKIRGEGKDHRKTAKHASYYEGPTVDLVYIEIPKDMESFKKVIGDMIPIFKLCVDIKTETQLEDLDLINKIKQIDSWDWYLSEDRKGLAELITERFNIEVTPAKLKTIKNKIREH